MPDDANDLTIYRNDRAGNIMRISLTEDAINLTTTGGENIKADEFAQIATFVDGHVGAEAFLVKLQKRMER